VRSAVGRDAGPSRSRASSRSRPSGSSVAVVGLVRPALGVTEPAHRETTRASRASVPKGQRAQGDKQHRQLGIRKGLQRLGEKGITFSSVAIRTI